MKLSPDGDSVLGAVSDSVIRAKQRLLHHAAAQDWDLLILRVTAFLVLLHGTTSALLATPIRILCGALLIFPGAITIPALWWFLVAGLVGGNSRVWFAIDNHQYLLTFWVLACAASLHVRDRARWLAVTARLLVAVVFSFATAWKLLSDHFADGTFFYVTLLQDSRLTRIAAWIGSVPLSELESFRQAVAFLGTQGLSDAWVQVPEFHRLRILALWMSLAGLALEASVAVAHLLPARRIQRVRHSLLMLFIAVTYFVLPVVGFGMILVLLGLAQTRNDEVHTRLAYLLLLVGLQAALAPWQQFLPV